MKAVIFAGGEGKRLYPLTHVVPKPLLPVANKPMLEWVMDNICKCTGIEEFVIINNYKAELIESHVRGLDYRIELIREKEFLGTAGGLGLIGNKIDSDFIVWNSDTFAFFDFAALEACHRKGGSLCTVCVIGNDIRSQFGEMVVGPSGKMAGVREKPVFSHTVNTGIYMFSPRVFGHVGKGSMGMDVLLNSIISEVGCFRLGGRDVWVDIGNFATFIAANRILLRMFGLREKGGAACRLAGNYSVGPGARIGAGSSVRDSSIGEGAAIGANTILESSVIFPGASIGDGCVIRDSIIGYGASVAGGTFVCSSMMTGAAGGKGEGARLPGGCLQAHDE